MVEIKLAMAGLACPLKRVPTSYDFAQRELSSQHRPPSRFYDLNVACHGEGVQHSSSENNF